MNIQKKQIIKEDGRSLIFYHFERSASPQQSAAFAAVKAEAATETQPTSTPSKNSGGENV